MNMEPTDVNWILWSGTLGFERPLEQRVDAALAAGFATISISPLDVANQEAKGTTAVELGNRIRAAGLDLIMDPAMNWCEGTEPSPSIFDRFSIDETLRMCEEVKVTSLTVIGPSLSNAPVEALAASFQALCDRAAVFGARVHLEFVPFRVVADLKTAWTIVSDSDRGNGGLVFDTWHFFRGSHDFELLEQIPGDKIFVVQISDAAQEVHGSLREGATRRLLPGDGCFDLPRVVRVLNAIGGLRAVGPEVISPTLAAMPAREAATLAASRVRDLVLRAADL